MRVLGGGANLLVDDAGVDGVVIRLDHDCFTSRKYNRHGEVDRALVASGSDLFKLVNETARHGLDGLSQLAGIPGTLGGAIRMNAGGNFGDIGQVIESVSMLDMTGRRIEIDRDELTFDYRQSSTFPMESSAPPFYWLEPTDPVKTEQGS